MLETYAQAVFERRYSGVSEAAREFLQEREALRRRNPNTEWLQARRTFPGVVWHIQERSRVLGRLSPRQPWTAAEMRLVDRYSRAIVRGRYSSVKQAAPDLQRDLLRLHEKRPKSGQGLAARTRWGTFARLLAYSRAHGRKVSRHFAWSAQEKRVVEDYARALLRGRFANATEAARACHRDFERLRRRYPHAGWLAGKRTPVSIMAKLLARANRLGRRPQYIAWTRQELRMIDAYARRVVKGEFNARQAARVFLRETERLHEKYPKLGWLMVRRSFRTTHDKIWVRAQELGRPFIELAWSPLEIGVATRFVRALLAGEYRNGAAAARVAVGELEALRRRHPNARWTRMRRTYVATKGKIVQLAHAMAEGWRQSHWSTGEKAILERCAQKLMRGDYPSVNQAAKACHLEFERRYARKRRPGARQVSAPRSLKTIISSLAQRTRELGRADGTPDWGREELRIAGAWSQRFQVERDASPRLRRYEAAQGMKEELAKLGFHRTLKACAGRLASRPRDVGPETIRAERAPWSRHESMIAERFARALLQGRYDSAREAALACQSELAHRQRLQVGILQPQPPRGLDAVIRRIVHVVRGRGRVWPGAWWSRQEDDVVRPFAKALAEGRYHGSTTAARACLQELVRQRRRHPANPWLGRRTATAVAARLMALASELGWRGLRRKWAPAAKRLARASALAFDRGEYATYSEAAQACLSELERLRSDDPEVAGSMGHYSVAALKQMIARLATRSVHPRAEGWSREESALLDRYARKVVSHEYNDCAEASRAFLKEAEQQGEFGRAGRRERRTYAAVFHRMLSRARALGRAPASPTWSEPEKELLGNYTQALLRGRYANARGAAGDLHRELIRRARESPADYPPRTLSAVRAMLVNHSRAQGRHANRHVRWSAVELQLLDRYVDAFLQGAFRSKVEAADKFLQQLQAERQGNPDAGLPAPQRTRESVITRLANSVAASDTRPIANLEPGSSSSASRSRGNKASDER
jgi:hypothetical protein